MAVPVSNSFITQYETDVHHVFQRKGTRMKPTVRFVDDVVGSSTTFQKIGTGVATTKARHGKATPMNPDHTAVTCTLEDFNAGDYVDLLDESKLNINERMVIATAGARALGRKIDEQVFDVLDSTSQTTVSWTVTSKAAIRNSLIDMVEALTANDAYDEGEMFGVLSSKAWAMASIVDEFANADWVGADGQALRHGPAVGRFKSWNGVLWQLHTGCPGKATSTGKVFVYHKDAVGYAAGKVPMNVASMSGDSPVAVDISWVGEAISHWVVHWMSGGACLIDDGGVIEGNLDETASLPTS